MVGAAITVYDLLAHDLKLIFFTGTSDSSNKLDFSEFSSIKLVLAWSATNPGATADATTTVTDAGDVTFSSETALVGIAIVQD